MKAVGNGQQHQPHQVESIPKQCKSQNPLDQQAQAMEPAPGALGLPAGELGQAAAAQHAIIMFGDAFAAEKAPALRTANHGFTPNMVVTSLLGKVLHCFSIWPATNRNRLFFITLSEWRSATDN